MRQDNFTNGAIELLEATTTPRALKAATLWQNRTVTQQSLPLEGDGPQDGAW
jgi:hypothetical protein